MRLILTILFITILYLIPDFSKPDESMLDTGKRIINENCEYHSNGTHNLQCLNSIHY